MQLKDDGCLDLGVKVDMGRKKQQQKTHRFENVSEGNTDCSWPLLECGVDGEVSVFYY